MLWQHEQTCDDFCLGSWEEAQVLRDEVLVKLVTNINKINKLFNLLFNISHSIEVVREFISKSNFVRYKGSQ